jgi:hypothetical protein
VQKLIATILLISLFGQTFNQGWYYVDYMVRKQEYVKRCENKARPQMNCNGKCQMMKKIQEKQQRENGPAPELKLTAKTDVLSSRSFFPSFQSFLILSKNIFPVQRSIGQPIDHADAFFHPPDLA